MIFCFSFERKCHCKNIISKNIIKGSQLNYTVKANNVTGTASFYECAVILTTSESPDLLSHS